MGEKWTHAKAFMQSWFSTFWFKKGKSVPLPKNAACTLEAVEGISADICVLVNLFLCLLPLALARIIPAIVNQTVFRSLTSPGEDDVQELAGFGIASNVYTLFECSLAAFCTVSQVLVKTRRDRILVLCSALLVCLLMMLTCAVLAATHMGTLLITSLFHVDDEVVRIAQKTLGLLSALLLIQALAEIHVGILIQSKETTPIFISSLFNLGIQMVISITCAGVARDELSPLAVPTAAFYAGNASKLLVLLIWYYKRVHWRLEPSHADAVPVGLSEIVEVFIPLASLATARAITVPVSRIFMGRYLAGHEASLQNAVFSLILPVERLFTSWLNRLKDVYLAFNDETVTDDRRLLFTVYCLLTSVGGMGIFCGIRQISDTYFHNIFRLDWHVAHRCTVAMSVFLFLPFFSCLRAHAIYWLVNKKHTKMILPFVFLRLLALPMTEFVLNKMHIKGAEQGAGLCVACHGVEAFLLLFVALCLKNRKQKPEETYLLAASA